jgi:type VI secretion system secreted protein VgrG
MSNATLQFASEEESLSVRRWTVEEALSGLFEVQVIAVSPKGDLDLGPLVGRGASFRLAGGQISGGAQGRCWGGLCRSASLTRVEEAETGLSTYEIALVPWLWLLTQRRNNRLYQHVSIPDIAVSLLAEWGLQPELRLDAGAYPPLELRVQYEETDHAFFSRLLEEAGITYSFEDAGDAGSLLVLSDRPGARELRPLPIVFSDTVSQTQRAGVEFVSDVHLREEVRPGRVTLRDHDFRKPGFPLFSLASPAAPPEERYEHYLHRPGSFLVEGASPRDGRTPVGDDIAVARFEQPAGTALAQRSLEALRAGRRAVSFTTSVISLSAGSVFRMAAHPRPDLSVDRPLLVTAMRFEGEIDKDWRTTANAVFAEEPYRPAQITPRPRIFGVQSAVVVGPASVPGPESFPSGAAAEEIYTDEHGRVRVQFHWDREGRLDRNSSIWMRVSQGWAGPGYGMFTVPRVGHEVLVGFLDGDPDSPLVVGRVHNAKEPVPHALPANRTVSTWRSASSPRTGGFNEIRFDDAAGREMVFEQAERDRARVVKHDEIIGVGNDRTRAVQQNETVTVGASRHRTTGINDHLTVGNHRSETVGSCRSAVVGVDDTVVVGAKHSVTVARGLTEELKSEIERVLRGPLGPILMGPIAQVLGNLPNAPYGGAAPGAAIEGLLASLGSLTAGHLQNVLRVLDGYVATPGPDPTTMEIVDRRITLTTGEASIVLDGPNITLMAAGNIMLHARGSVGVLGDAEAAIAGDKRVLVLSRAGDAVVQGAPNVHLNPLTEVPGPPAARTTAIQTPEGGPAPVADGPPPFDVNGYATGIASLSGEHSPSEDLA